MKCRRSQADKCVLQIQQTGLIGEVENREGAKDWKAIVQGGYARLAVVDEDGGVAKIHCERNGFVLAIANTQVEVGLGLNDDDPTGKMGSRNYCRRRPGVMQFPDNGWGRMDGPKQFGQNVNMADQNQVIKRSGIRDNEAHLRRIPRACFASSSNSAKEKLWRQPWVFKNPMVSLSSRSRSSLTWPRDNSPER